MQELKKKTNTKMSKKTSAQAKKYDDCVGDVKAKGDVDNAYAVCQSSVLHNHAEKAEPWKTAWEQYKIAKKL